jgi:hypothetical protein
LIKKKKKKIKSTFKDPKSLNMAKMHFWEKLKNEAFAQKLFFYLETLFLKCNPKQALNITKEGHKGHLHLLSLEPV